MKGIILAAGKGRRLYPLTKGIPKALLPVYDRPIIYFALEFMKKAGVEDVMVVVSEDNERIIGDALEDGALFGLRLQYRVQRELNGTAGAVRETVDFIEDDDVLLYYSDNVLIGFGIETVIETGLDNVRKNRASVLATRVGNPSSYGVLEIDEEGSIISLEEKPLRPKSNFVAPGVYFYPADLTKKLANVELSSRGEYEITDVNRMYLDEERLSAVKLPDDILWYDTGDFDVLLEAGNMVCKYEKER